MFEAGTYKGEGGLGQALIVYWALLSQGDIRLDAGSHVLGAVHSGAVFYAARGSRLYGRVSATDEIALEPECRFRRLHAPRICFGQVVAPRPGSGLIERLRRLRPPVDAQSERGRLLVGGDWVLPQLTFHRGHLAAGGRLEVGAGSLIGGSLKSSGPLLLQTNVRIDGPLMCSRSVWIGPGCRVSGPVVAEEAVFIDAGCVIGSLDRPTSVTAPEIYVACGSVVHGVVWASEEGVVRQEIKYRR